jgi:PA domain
MNLTVMHMHTLNPSVPGMGLATMGRPRADLFMRTMAGRGTTTNSSRKVGYGLLRLPFPAGTDAHPGVDFTGAIVIVRYGGVFRGLKVSRLKARHNPIHYPLSLAQVKGAQELGAAGVLIYSDPRDDGMVTEKNGYAA